MFPAFFSICDGSDEFVKLFVLFSVAFFFIFELNLPLVVVVVVLVNRTIRR